MTHTKPAADYLTDYDYPAVFHPEQAPLWLSAVLAGLGRKPPRVNGARWCEIGCGEGFAVTVLAAANPGMDFTGIDLNPAHIAKANERSAAAGLKNVRFHLADIAAPDAPGGSFDYIVTHGLFSWVGDAVREGVATWAARHLAPGGVAAIQYMSEPGGSAFRAFHGVFRSVRHHADPVAEGLRRLTAMRDAKAGFFQLHPHASRTLDNLLRETPGYVAHEYLNPDFRPLSFAEVADTFSDAGFSWAGSATPIENIDAASLPSGAAKHIAPVLDTVERETLKDMARNQALRYDLFCKPEPLPDADGHLGLLRPIIWRSLPGAPKPGRVTFETPIGPVEGEAGIFGPLLERLGSGPARFSEIEQVPPFSGRPGLLNQALQMALWARMVHPVPGKAADCAAAGRLNAVLLNEARAGVQVPALAAPGIGSGLLMTPARLDRLTGGKADAVLRQLLGLD